MIDESEEYEEIVIHGYTHTSNFRDTAARLSTKTKVELISRKILKFPLAVNPLQNYELTVHTDNFLSFRMDKVKETQYAHIQGYHDGKRYVYNHMIDVYGFPASKHTTSHDLPLEYFASSTQIHRSNIKDDVNIRDIMNIQNGSFSIKKFRHGYVYKRDNKLIGYISQVDEQEESKKITSGRDRPRHVMFKSLDDLLLNKLICISSNKDIDPDYKRYFSASMDNSELLKYLYRLRDLIDIDTFENESAIDEAIRGLYEILFYEYVWQYRNIIQPASLLTRNNRLQQATLDMIDYYGTNVQKISQLMVREVHTRDTLEIMINYHRENGRDIDKHYNSSMVKILNSLSSAKSVPHANIMNHHKSRLTQLEEYIRTSSDVSSLSILCDYSISMVNRNTNYTNDRYSYLIPTNELVGDVHSENISVIKLKSSNVVSSMIDIYSNTIGYSVHKDRSYYTYDTHSEKQSKVYTQEGAFLSHNNYVRGDNMYIIQYDMHNKLNNNEFDTKMNICNLKDGQIKRDVLVYSASMYDYIIGYSIVVSDFIVAFIVNQRYEGDYIHSKIIFYYDRTVKSKVVRMMDRRKAL